MQTPPHLDDGCLGVAVVAAHPEPGKRPPWRAWTAEEFTVDAQGAVPAGIDGEALLLEPPLRFRSRPRALRCRSCAFDADCRGLHVNYVRAHGYEVMQPIASVGQEK